MAVVEADRSRAAAMIIGDRPPGIEAVAPRAAAADSKACDSSSVGIGRARRQDRGLAMDAELARERAVVEEDARQAGAGAQFVLGQERTRAVVAGGEIERLPRPPAAGEPAPLDQRGQPGDGVKAAAIRMRAREAGKVAIMDTSRSNSHNSIALLAAVEPRPGSWRSEEDLMAARASCSAAWKRAGDARRRTIQEHAAEIALHRAPRRLRLPLRPLRRTTPAGRSFRHARDRTSFTQGIAEHVHDDAARTEKFPLRSPLIAERSTNQNHPCLHTFGWRCVVGQAGMDWGHGVCRASLRFVDENLSATAMRRLGVFPALLYGLVSRRYRARDDSSEGGR